MFHLKNLSSQAVKQEVLPWSYTPPVPILDNVRKDKKARDAWINAPATDFYVYSFNEGINPNLRISKPKPDGSGNPIHATHALVADYDSPQPWEKVLEFLKTLTYQPNWVERTLSGNWRFIWGLEEPIIHPSDGFARHFFKRFSEFAFDPSKAMPGFDKRAWDSPERIWTNGCEWHFIHDKVLPAELSAGWLVKAGQLYRFTEKEFGVAVPLDLVKTELEKKFPKFSASWTGDFAPGAQGPTFWLMESTSPKSAIVRETGMQTFSAHAAKGFYNWADLLGIDFVRRFEAETIGRAVEDIYYDNRHYWRKITNGSWQPSDKADIMMHLKASRGLSDSPGQGRVSSVIQAVEYIQNVQRIKSAGPFVLHPSGIIYRDKQPHLNIADRQCIQPADGPQVWGPTGNFPWLCEIYEMFDEYPRIVVLAWLKWAYENALKLEPTLGQVLFIAGPVDIGKSFLNRYIHGTMFGGFADAGAYLMGQDDFAGDLFGYYYWCLDDGSPSADPKIQRYFALKLKHMTANSDFRVNLKYVQAMMGIWLGRIGITLNTDMESVGIIPATTISNKDKLILVRTRPVATAKFSADYKENIGRVNDQLPYFCRWLLDWKIPKQFLGGSRYGVKEYADPTLLEHSRQSSPMDTFYQVFEQWRRDYFTNRDPNAQEWRGTSFNLYQDMITDPGMQAVLRTTSMSAIGRHLISLHEAGAGIEPIEEGKDTPLRVWRVPKPKGM